MGESSVALRSNVAQIPATQSPKEALEGLKKKEAYHDKNGDAAFIVGTAMAAVCIMDPEPISKAVACIGAVAAHAGALYHLHEERRAQSKLAGFSLRPNNGGSPASKPPPKSPLRSNNGGPGTGNDPE